MKPDRRESWRGVQGRPGSVLQPITVRAVRFSTYITSRYFQCCSQLQYAQFQSLHYLEVLSVLQPITVRAPIYYLISSAAANYSTQSLYLASPQGSRYFRRLCEICQASAAEAPMGDCPHLQYGVSVCVCVWPGNAIGDYFLACSRVTSRRKSNMTV